MKKERSTLSKKITSYSSLAASLLTVSNLVNAQIVYTDVNPDDAQANNGAEYDLDLNNDATVDFKITISSTGGAVKMAAEAIGDNAIAGTYYSPYIYPSAFALNETIGDSRTWNSGAGQTLASSGYFQGAYGHWFGAVDKYMGLRLKVGTDNFYGWMRMDVAEDGKSFVIKDYAYESEEGTAINAGDVGNVGITPVPASGIRVFAADQQVHVQLSNNAEGDVIFSNLVGQTIKAVKIDAAEMTIDMAGQPTGIYMVTVRQNGQVFSQKVAL
ncbi:MAG: T9SS type A sorting domain-containing protein [Chitinophagales bacterium]|nr:T9SS type A sorting domain-containing protein [Chitinophagales bacterium]